MESERGSPLRQLVTLARALADENRLRALLLLGPGELCLCQIVHVLGAAPSTVSKHLDVLARAGLVRREKRGRWHYFRLADRNANAAVRRVLGLVRTVTAADPLARSTLRARERVVGKDLERLAACYRD